MSERVEVFTHIAGTSAEKLALRGMYETMQEGHLFSIHVTPDVEVIAAYHGEEVVAFVTFEEYEDIGEFWIVFGYCLPEFRRQGYYRSCIAKLREIATERGYVRIHTAVHPNNTGARLSIEARGGTLQYHGYVFPVENKNEDSRTTL